MYQVFLLLLCIPLISFADSDLDTDIELYSAVPKLKLLYGSKEFSSVLDWHCWRLKGEMRCANHLAPAGDPYVLVSPKQSIQLGSKGKIKFILPENFEVESSEYRIYKVSELAGVKDKLLPNMEFWKEDSPDGKYSIFDIHNLFELNLKPGKYILSVSIEWKAMGNSVNNFLVSIASNKALQPISG